MFKLGHILVPTDFSELSAQALPCAIRLAERFGAKITLLYADLFADPIDLVGGSFGAHDPEQIEQLRALAKERLEGFAREHLPSGVRWQAAVEVATPFRAIVEFASEADIDLIVMGTHGRTGWRRAILGSVAEAVLRETNKPVLTVRQKAGAATAAGGAISKILCPVNYSAVARDSMEFATALASAFDADILIVHVIEIAHTQDEEHVDRFKVWLPGGVGHRYEFRELVLRSDPAEQIVDLARSEHADLVVIGAQHKRFSDTTVIGTTTERITRHAPCPVLTVIRRVEGES